MQCLDGGGDVLVVGALCPPVFLWCTVVCLVHGCVCSSINAVCPHTVVAGSQGNTRRYTQCAELEVVQAGSKAEAALAKTALEESLKRAKAAEEALQEAQSSATEGASLASTLQTSVAEANSRVAEAEGRLKEVCSLLLCVFFSVCVCVVFVCAHCAMWCVASRHNARCPGNAEGDRT